MTMKTIARAAATAAAMLAAMSCKGTWLMYDNSQKAVIYFMEKQQIHSSSFALIPEDEIEVQDTIRVMGTPSEHDRTFSVEYVQAEEGQTFSTGNKTYPVVTARPGIDFEVVNPTIPAGEVKPLFTIKIYRREEMLDKYMLIGLRLVENDDFRPCATDSTSTSRIMSPIYCYYITDGEPSCPNWWKYNSKSTPGWDFSWGNFYPQKFRKLLEYFHATKETNPTFYEYAVAKYGYNLENPSNEEKFWRKGYASAWAKYVAMPLYEYYLNWYAEHPDDPNYEDMGSSKVNMNAQIGWGDPMSGTYGFLN